MFKIKFKNNIQTKLNLVVYIYEYTHVKTKNIFCTYVNSSQRKVELYNYKYYNNKYGKQNADL